jgi:hypothetical protein
MQYFEIKKYKKMKIFNSFQAMGFCRYFLVVKKCKIKKDKKMKIFV